MTTSLPTLGVGLGFRTPFKADLFLQRESVDFLEITADHYLDVPPEKERELDLLAEHFTLIPHGLNLSLGSAEGLDSEYLRELARLVRRLDPPWWSEHIAFTRAGGRDIGHLSPLPYTDEALNALCRNVAEVRRHLDVPLILENISYVVALPGAEMGEAEFLAEVTERTGCGLLLDVMNLHANAVNHGYDPRRFLDRLPLERVVQLHFVGGHWSEDILVDSHSEPTPPEVWGLLDEVLSRAPVKGVILERDENIPPFRELVRELERAREIGRRHGRWP
ncbi:MAG: DUF692 domain-containing protein [Chloroflexota bacterium]|nr:DUF692 domain-containing protein [Chloroflexota bacterium]